MKKTTALITGSTGGLGSCFVKLHAERGGDLILVSREQDKLDAQKAEVEAKYGVKAQVIAADLSKSSVYYSFSQGLYILHNFYHYILCKQTKC